MNDETPRFFKILVGFNKFAFIKALEQKFFVMSDATISQHVGQLSIESMNGKPILRAHVNGKPLEFYELWTEITENNWKDSLLDFLSQGNN